jgi:hypothetical protein
MEEKIEYQGENFTMSWDPEKETLFITTKGSHDEKDARDLVEKFSEILKKTTVNPLKILIEANKTLKSDHEARRIYSNFVKEARKNRNTIIALCSANVFVRMVGKFIAVAAGSTMKFNLFANTEDGSRWLEKYKK